MPQKHVFVQNLPVFFAVTHEVSSVEASKEGNQLKGEQVEQEYELEREQ